MHDIEVYRMLEVIGHNALSRFEPYGVVKRKVDQPWTRINDQQEVAIWSHMYAAVV